MVVGKGKRLFAGGSVKKEHAKQGRLSMDDGDTEEHDKTGDKDMWDNPAARAEALARSLGNCRTRSGRVSLPPLDFWRHQVNKTFLSP